MFSQAEAQTIVRLAGDGDTDGILYKYTHDNSTYGESNPMLRCRYCGVTVMSVGSTTSLAEQVATALIHEQEWHS